MNPITITQHFEYDLRESGEITYNNTYGIFTSDECIDGLSREDLVHIRTLIDMHLGNTPPPPESEQ